MLMRFSISNFMSYNYKTVGNDEKILPTEFYLYACSKKQMEEHQEHVITFGERKVLRFASVFGANASGKTALIKAIAAGKDIIANTISNNSYKNKYCKCDAANENKPTLFEYELTIENTCYAYGFTVNLAHGVILSEWLYKLEGSKESVVFERVTEKYYFDKNIFSNKESEEYFEYVLHDMRGIHDSLVLFEIHRRNFNNPDFKIFRQIYDWFNDKLEIIHFDVKQDEEYNLIDIDKNNKRLADSLRYFDIDCNYSEASGGTRDLIDISKVLLEDEDRTYIIDDIDRRLHPIVVRNFIDLYLRCLQDGQSQLIITSHKTNLMDLKLLRRDEIWFTEKEKVKDKVDKADKVKDSENTEQESDKNISTDTDTVENNITVNNFSRSTDLYSLARFTTTFDSDLPRAYLAGRFGAVPNIGE